MYMQLLNLWLGNQQCAVLFCKDWADFSKLPSILVGWGEGGEKLSYWKDNNGRLSLKELTSLPNVNNNPLIYRIVDILDTDGDGEIDFQEFIEGLSQFSVKGWFHISSNLTRVHTKSRVPPGYFLPSNFVEMRFQGKLHFHMHSISPYLIFHIC